MAMLLLHKNPIIKDGVNLEELIRRDYTPEQERTKSNNQYLIDCLEKRGELWYANSIELLKDHVASKLKSVDHTFRKHIPLMPVYGESFKNVYEMSSRQLIRVDLLLEALEHEVFKDFVGSLIEDDLNDKFGEHGGLVLFNDVYELVLQSVESADYQEKESALNKHYRMPAEALAKPHIARYHIHASSEDSSKYSGPSGGTFIFRSGDIGNCYERTMQCGEDHNIVITKLRGPAFNIDFYSGELRNNKPVISVLDLGNYSY